MDWLILPYYFIPLYQKYYPGVYTGAGGFQKSARRPGGQSRRPLTPRWGEKKGHPKDGNYLSFEVVGDSMECDCKNNISDCDLVIAREVAKHHWKNKLHIPDTFVIVQRMDGIRYV